LVKNFEKITKVPFFGAPCTLHLVSFRVAKLGYEKESKSYKIEKFFALQPEHQLHEEELYIELCTHDFEVDINEDEGYPVKFIDLSVKLKLKN
jgi:hypothetical protein